MLQEITIDDLKNVHSRINKEELIVVYNVMRKYQEEIGTIKNYYFDDNFCWRKIYGTRDSVLGTTLYNSKLSLYGLDIEYKQLIKQFLKKEGISIKREHIESYLWIIFNKLRPTDEYYNNYLKEKEQVEIVEKVKENTTKREDAFQKIKDIGVKVEEGKYCFDKVAQKKLQIALTGRVVTILKSLKIQYSWGTQDPKSNWALLYVYDDNYQIKEEVFDNYVEEVKKGGWRLINRIDEMMHLQNIKFTIYGILVEEELVYIGKTCRPLYIRLLEHLTQDMIHNKRLYDAMITGKFSIAIMFEDSSQSIITCDTDLQTIEKKLIEYYRPKYNIEGVIKPYRYH